MTAEQIPLDAWWVPHALWPADAACRFCHECSKAPKRTAQKVASGRRQPGWEQALHGYDGEQVSCNGKIGTLCCNAERAGVLVTGQSKRFSLAEFERFAGSRAGNPKMSLKMVTSGARVGMLADQMRCTPDEQQLTTSNATNPIKRPNNGWDGKCRPADQVYCSLCGKHTGTRSIFWRRLCRVTYKGANPYMFSDTCCTTNPRAGAQVDLIGAIVHAEFAGCVVCCG